MKRAAEAGVDHHDAAVGGEAVARKVLQVEVEGGVAQRVGAQQGGGVPAFEPRGGQVILPFEHGAQRVGVAPPLAGRLQACAAVGLDPLAGLARHAGHGNLVEVLRVVLAVMVEQGEVEVVAHELVHEVLLHGVDVAVVHVADGLALPAQHGEVLVEPGLFVHARRARLGDVAVAAEKEDAAQLRAGPLFGHELAQVAAQLLVARGAAHVGGAYAAAVQVGLEALLALGRQRIVEVGLALVAAQGRELQAEVVVEAVGGHRRAAAVHLLVHLEGARQVLGVAYHGHGYVAHEDAAFERRAAVVVHAAQGGTDRVGHAPAVHEDVGRQAVGFAHGGGIGLHLGAGLGVALRVDDDGKAAACCGAQGGQQGGRGGE